MQRKAAPIVVLAAILAAIPLRAQEEARLKVARIKDLTLRFYGFVETDIINDSTEGLTEEQDNNSIQTRTVTGGGADNYAGHHHQTQMSVRNSRLGFELTLPKRDSGLATQGIIELDMMGNNGPNVPPGATPAPTQNERDFFNNPAVRVRHAYLNMTRGGTNLKAGQYWSLLGWQPYNFQGEVVVYPAVGQLYRRFPQLRLTQTQEIAAGWTVEAAGDLAKPAQMNSGLPQLHGGLRIVDGGRKALSLSGFGTAMTSAWTGVSAALIPVRSDVGNANGAAAAFNFFVPILASRDGKDRSNNLSVSGEAMSGNGVGGLEYAGLSSNVKQVTTASPGAPGTNIDSGMAGIDAAGGLELIRYRTFRAQIQYALPSPRWCVAAGYAQVEARNLDRFSNALNRNKVGGLDLTPKKQYGFFAVFYDPADWLRFGGELNQTRDTNNDPANRHAINNRLQFSTFFIF